MNMHVIAGRYRPTTQLGRGGMGVVWRARDERLGRDVAVKVLHPWVADDPDLRRRFEREAAALARLAHPNIVRLYDVVESEGQTVLVMELVDGVGLDTLVAGRALGWDEARHYCAPVAAALAHAHQRGVVHRDLAPANVLVEHGSGRVVVTDFGLARLARATRSVPISGILAGTPEYWAPEQASGAETEPATDLYALGCILFRLLAGRVPFEGEDRLAAGLRRAHEPAPSLAVVAPDAPDEAVVLVDRLLERTPALRGDAVDAAVALGADPASLPGSPRLANDATDDARGESPQALPATLVTRILRDPATVVQRVRAHRSLHRGRLAAVAVALLAVLGLAGGGVYAIAGDEPGGVDAPDVIGLRVAAARSELTERARADGLPVPALKVVDRSYSESAPAGAIIAQDPPQGDRILERGALLVSVSRGSAYAEVPSVAGLAGEAAFALLERNGFTPSRRYSPSAEIEAWHAVETAPAAGERVKRPARVELVVSTGPPKRIVPSIDGLDAAQVEAALRRAGFVPAVEERSSDEVPPGTVLGIRPDPGARAPLGSTVTIVVARAPRPESVLVAESTEDFGPQAIGLQAGGKLVVATDPTSPGEDDDGRGKGRGKGKDKDRDGDDGGTVTITWSGDEQGATTVGAGESAVLLEAADRNRTLVVTVDVEGAAHWRLAVEVRR